MGHEEPVIKEDKLGLIDLKLFYLKQIYIAKEHVAYYDLYLRGVL